MKGASGTFRNVALLFAFKSGIIDQLRKGTIVYFVPEGWGYCSAGTYYCHNQIK